MICLHCTKLDLKSRPSHSKCGFGVCPLDPSGTFVSITFKRVCKSFNQAPAETIAAREKWAAKL